MLTAKTETVADIHDLLALTPLAPTEILGRTERGLREATSDPEMTMKAAEEEAPIVDGLVCVTKTAVVMIADHGLSTTI